MIEFVPPALWILAGLVLLVVGGELLVRGASALAGIAKIDPLVIGLTVVAFGTSAPELAVSLQAAWKGNADLALGNVVGSNIANILLILGVSALVAPLAVASRLVRLDVPVMIAASVALVLMCLDGSIGRLDGALLFGAMIVYTVWLVGQSRRESRRVESEFEGSLPHVPPTLGHVLLQIVYLLAALLLLAGGAHWLVGGATRIARLLEVPDLIIGLTVVAVGTSLPELAASVMASVRGQRDIAVGNCVGSNILNILIVLGMTGMVAPGGVSVPPVALRLDLPIMIAVAVSCLPIFFSGKRIRRWEGELFLGYYAAYNYYLFLVQSKASLTEVFGFAMVGVVIPLTVITLLVATLQTVRENHRGKNVDSKP